MMMDHPEMSCATCIWWQRSAPKLANAKRDPAAGLHNGICQSRPPIVVSFSPFPLTLFPETHESRFCGEWEGRSVNGGDGDGERVIAFPVANRVAA